MRRLFAAALAVSLASCGLTDTTQPTPNLIASYALQTVNGVSLPYTSLNGTTVTSDVLSLFSDGTYSDVAQLSGGSVSVEEGHFNNNNGSITFTELTSGAQYRGSITGTVLTEIVGNLTEVYQQR